MKINFYPLLIFILGASFFYPAASAEESVYNLEPIVIVPTKSSLCEAGGLRRISVISAARIEQLPVRSVAELLQHISGVDIRQRGAQGVQADVNILGSNFEQVLICLNGVRLNDPQSGHHNLDLPLTLTDIARVEVLPGQGSSIYGPGAFAGTINIVTKEPQGQVQELEACGGNFDFNSQAISVNWPLATVKNRLSFSRQESSGYRPDTDFEINSLSFNAQKEFSWGGLEYLFGYSDKDFGADSFYSNLYAQEEEHTDTRFFNLKAHINNEITRLKSDFYFRRHTDKFILDRTRPAWYVNYHTSYSYGVDLEAYRELDFGSLLLGGEIWRQKITSTRLGHHARNNQALYAQFQSPAQKRLVGNLGLRLDHIQSWDWQVCPSIGAGYKINPQWRLKASGGRSFRVPSFTDLYYQSPANVGNEDLSMETAWSAETGIEFSDGSLFAELTYLRRWADDIIGWARSTENEAWAAQNIGQVDTQGWGLELSLSPEDLFLSQVAAGYVYQYIDSESFGLNEKYTLDFLKHQAHLDFVFEPVKDFSQSLNLSYKQRIDQRPYFLLDSRISKKINKFNAEIFLDITNLLNTSYSEQGDVARPGRWVIAGMKIKL